MNKLIISLLAFAGAITASAQNFVGSWELFPSYSTPNKIIDTPEYVYTLTGANVSSNLPTGGSLAFYDKTTGEVGALNITNRLNANKVYNIWYAPKEKCLLVIYDDFNIDLLYDDGRTINVPDLKDAVISDDKFVNDAGFSNGKAFLGLNSGLLIIDMAHGAIEESALWGKKITKIAASEKKILMLADNYLYIGNIAGSHHNFDKSFAYLGGLYSKPVSNLIYIGNHCIYATYDKGYVYHINENNDINNKAFWMEEKTDHPRVSEATAVPTSTGAMSTTGSTVNYIDSNGNVTSLTISAANGNKVADWAGDGKAPWISDATGFGKYDTTAKQFTIAKMKPKGTSGSNVGRIIQHPLTNDFYISTAEVHQNTTILNLAFTKQTYADIYSVSEKKFISIPSNLLAKSMYGLQTVRDNSNLILQSSFGSGLRLIDLNTNTFVTYNTENSILSNNGIINSPYVDSNGNLWAYESTNKGSIYKALKGSWEKSMTPSGWSSISIPQIVSEHSNRMIIDESKNIAVMTCKTGIAAVMLPDVNKPLTSSCKTVLLENSVDSDGSSINGWVYPALAIDKNGWIWIGNEKGVMYIKDSREMFNPGFAVTRPKVARNDGTNLADYLLTQVEVMCIAVDENNNKWIGTMGSGLYRVNEDGTEILEHLTTENSDIPSNNILAVCPDRNSNDIYIGTPDGLSIYHSTTSPAAEDYKNTYAYPNPVTPDYTGFITITNLKANSLIKITDASGNIIHETMSNGGMALWNGCDASGRRVRSGVYFVFASQTGEDASGAAVTKIVVVN